MTHKPLLSPAFYWLALLVVCVLCIVGLVATFTFSTALGVVAIIVITLAAVCFSIDARSEYSDESPVDML